MSNPLTPDIKALFPQEFEVARRGGDMIREQTGLVFSDDELGYIALHVHSSLESMHVSQAMQTAAIIRENLAKAVEYKEKLDRAQADPDEEKPDYDAKLEALLPVVRGELPVHIHAHRADDIATGVRISRGVRPEVRHRPRHRGPPDPRSAGAGGSARHHRALPGGPVQARAGEHDH